MGSKDHCINAFIIAGALYVLIQFCSQYSGGCLNPAVGIVQQLYQFWTSTNIDSKFLKILPPKPYAMWIYITAPSLGAICAGLFQVGTASTLKKVGNE